MTPIAVITSDTHLAQRAWARYPDLAGDAYFSFSQVIDHCVAYNLPLVLAGDVFDKTRPDPITIYETRKQLERLDFACLDLFYIQGQHELDRKQPWLSAIAEFPKHIHKKSVTLSRGPTIFGIDWTSAAEIKKILKDVPVVDILIMHQVWSDFMSIGGIAVECSFSDIKKDIPMLITGDFHKHMHVAYNNLMAYSPGSTCMQSITEPPDKAFYVLNSDLTMESIPLKTRQCFRASLYTSADLDKFLVDSSTLLCAKQLDISEEISKNIVYVKYAANIPNAYDRLTTAFTDVHLFLSPYSTKEKLAKFNKQFSKDSLLQYLPKVVGEDTALHSNLSVLLKAQDPSNQLELLRRSFESKKL